MTATRGNDLEKGGSVEHFGENDAAGPNIDFVRVGLIKTRSLLVPRFPRAAREGDNRGSRRRK